MRYTWVVDVALGPLDPLSRQNQRSIYGESGQQSAFTCQCLQGLPQLRRATLAEVLPFLRKPWRPQHNACAPDGERETLGRPWSLPNP